MTFGRVGMTNRTAEYYRNEAVKFAAGTDLLVMPIEGKDDACYQYRIRILDGREIPVYLPHGHRDFWDD